MQPVCEWYGVRDQQKIFQRQHEEFLRGVTEFEENAIEQQRAVFERMNNGREK